MKYRISTVNILLGLIVILICAFSFTYWYGKELKQRHFNEQAQIFAQKVEGDLQQKLSLLESYSAFFKASKFVDAQEWQQFGSINSRSEKLAYVLDRDSKNYEYLKKEYSLAQGAEAQVVYYSPDQKLQQQILKKEYLKQQRGTLLITTRLGLVGTDKHAIVLPL